MKMNEQLKKLVYFIGNHYRSYDPFILCEKMNIDVKYKPFLSEPLGETTYFRNRPIIILADSLRYSNQRYFVCAHELGHAINHQGLASFYTSNKLNKGKLEVEADKFACALIGMLYVEDTGEFPDSIKELEWRYGLNN